MGVRRGGALPPPPGRPKPVNNCMFLDFLRKIVSFIFGKVKKQQKNILPIRRTNFGRTHREGDCGIRDKEIDVKGSNNPSDVGPIPDPVSLAVVSPTCRS